MGNLFNAAKTCYFYLWTGINHVKSCRNVFGSQGGWKGDCTVSLSCLQSVRLEGYYYS